MAVKTWTGTTIAWGTNTQMNSAKVIEVIDFDVSRPEFETTDFGTSQPGSRELGGRTFEPGKLGEVMVTLRLQFDPTIDQPMAAADVAEVFTITPPTAVSSNTLSFSGFVTRMSQSMPLDGLPTSNVTIRVTGKMTTPSS